ncbi:30S ribosomal protein S3 [Candidatus Gottesmanbacteria bacterium]|nr:30S ribosomal protein S3 [Candidatus Gottesmanbacteria bacterium]
MGQKVNPKSFRIVTRLTWDSRWFADKRRYQDLLLADYKLRQALFKRLKPAGLARVEISRSITSLDVTLHVTRPGLVIGRGGSGLEDLKKFISNTLHTEKKHKLKVELHIEPVKEPNLNAYLMASLIADQLAKRIPHRRVANQAIEKIMTSGAKGVRIALAGRIAGAEISRREKFQHGRLPLSTIRENIDFASVPSLTKSGYIGVKVWICN